MSRCLQPSRRGRGPRRLPALAAAILLGLPAALLLVLPAAPARAHGPTVQVAWSGVRPETLTVRAGTTVHFHNANLSASPCTVVADDDSFRSPTLPRGEGWHHTFREVGTFDFHLAELPGARGRIVVVEP